MKSRICNLSPWRVLSLVIVFSIISILLSSVAKSIQGLFPSIFSWKVVVDVFQIIGNLGTALTLGWLVYSKIGDDKSKKAEEAAKGIEQTLLDLESCLKPDNFFVSRSRIMNLTSQLKRRFLDLRRFGSSDINEHMKKESLYRITIALKRLQHKQLLPPSSITPAQSVFAALQVDKFLIDGFDESKFQRFKDYKSEFRAVLILQLALKKKTSTPAADIFFETSESLTTLIEVLKTCCDECSERLQQMDYSTNKLNSLSNKSVNSIARLLLDMDFEVLAGAFVANFSPESQDFILFDPI